MATPTWVTPAGSLGFTSSGLPINTITIKARPTSGTILYSLVSGSYPAGMTVLLPAFSGTPSFVSTSVTSVFTIRATDSVTGEFADRVFSYTVTLAQFQWIDPVTSNIGLFPENQPLSIQFTALRPNSPEIVTYELLNGNLPNGLTTLSLNSTTGLLVGTPISVNNNTTNEFTIRARDIFGVVDKTFTLTVTGATVPTWTTPAGLLLSVDDSTWMSTQVVADSNDPNDVVVITLVSGSLPPGLEINSSGLIRGYATPPTIATLTSVFTLAATSVSGTTNRTFSIEIKNQQLNYVGVFPGRAPAILNDQPLTFVISESDPYYSYYTDGASIGKLDQSTDFIFKVIGYNFDTSGNQSPYDLDLTYSITNSNPVGAFTPVPPPTGTLGWINSVLATIGPNINSYSFDVTVSRTLNPTLTSGTKTFNFVIVGDINDSVTWDTPPDLGTIDNGAISDLTVQATFGGPSGQYRLASGTLPPGLEILEDGGISGRVEFDLVAYGPYIFTVEAFNPLYPATITATREFTLTVVEKYSEPYDTIYMAGLFSLPNRVRVANLLNQISITQAANIYRLTDPYFGVATEVRYQHQYGVPSVSATSPGDPNYFYNEYVEALQRNFYWKFLTLGTLKTAIATDSNGNTIYEVVYSDIIDNLVTAGGVSISKKVGFPNPITTNIGPYWTSWTTIYTSNTYYDLTPLVKSVIAPITPTTTLVLNNVVDLVVGMQVTGFPGVTITNNLDGTPPVLISIVAATNTVELSVAQTTLTNKQQIIFNEPITVSNGDIENGIDLYPNSLPNMREQIAEMIGQFDNSTLLPRWMNTQQPSGSVLGYVPCWVLCYTKPGKSAEVLENIQLYLAANNLTLNQITFQIDRITVDRSLTYTYGTTAFDQWPPTKPSASVDNNSQDSYINFPRKTIL